MNSFTSFGSSTTCSCTGASLWEMISGLSGLRNAAAMRWVRSTSSFQPNILLMTFMSPNRLVMTRCPGLPLTLWNSTGQPPSMCFCRPVTSRSGSTSFSVSIRSPCWRNQSSVERRSRPAGPAAVCGCEARSVAAGWTGFSLCTGCCMVSPSGASWAQYDRSGRRVEGLRQRASVGRTKQSFRGEIPPWTRSARCR